MTEPTKPYRHNGTARWAPIRIEGQELLRLRVPMNAADFAKITTAIARAYPDATLGSDVFGYEDPVDGYEDPVDDLVPIEVTDLVTESVSTD